MLSGEPSGFNSQKHRRGILFEKFFFYINILYQNLWCKHYNWNGQHQHDLLKPRFLKLDLSYDIPRPSENKNCQAEFETNLKTWGQNLQLPLSQRIIHQNTKFFRKICCSNMRWKEKSIMIDITIGVIWYWFSIQMLSDMPYITFNNNIQQSHCEHSITN